MDYFFIVSLVLEANMALKETFPRCTQKIRKISIEWGIYTGENFEESYCDFFFFFFFFFFYCDF